jgi:manganese/zinc/iron transport system substrate-binding protein
VIAGALAEAAPEQADAIRARGESLAAEITALDEWATRTLATVPADRRVLVTAHDAFNYFGRRFGFEVVGIQGLSTESEAGVRDIERIVDMLVERKIPAVFVESTVSDRNVKALIAGARARGHEVTIGGSLFSDAMGPPGSAEGTYVGMIAHNVRTITLALGGRVDEPAPVPAAVGSAP